MQQEISKTLALVKQIVRFYQLVMEKTKTTLKNETADKIKQEELHQTFHEFKDPFNSKFSAYLLHSFKIKAPFLPLLTYINRLLKEHQL